MASITDEPRAGTVNISVKLESQYCNRIYQQFERMMEWAYSTLNLRYTWKFHMFGNIYDDENVHRRPSAWVIARREIRVPALGSVAGHKGQAHIQYPRR